MQQCLSIDLSLRDCIFVTHNVTRNRLYCFRFVCSSSNDSTCFVIESKNFPTLSSFFFFFFIPLLFSFHSRFIRSNETKKLSISRLNRATLTRFRDAITKGYQDRMGSIDRCTKRALCILGKYLFIGEKETPEISSFIL